MPDANQGFVNNTRKMVTQLADVVRPTGGGQSPTLILPKVGFLGTIYLANRGSIAGSLSAPHASGFSSVLNRLRVTANQGTDIINMSGPGYFYLFRDFIDSGYIDVVGQANGRTAVTAAAFNLDMILPIMLNPRDPLGMLVLQNEAAQMSVGFDWLADGSVATGATVTATITPYLEWFTVPPNQGDWPNLGYLHSILEDDVSVAGAGDVTYPWLRGPIYLRTIHGLGYGASGTDAFSRAQFKWQQNEYIQNTDVKFLDMEFRRYHGRARPAGVIPFDFLSSSGLGSFGVPREWINSQEITDIQTVVTATGAGTMKTVREILIPVLPG